MSRFAPRSIGSLTLCLCLGLGSSLTGQETLKEPRPLPAKATAKPVVESLAASPKLEKTSATASRRKLEAQLRQPANLDFGDRQNVSVAEFLTEIRKQHKLSIRFDAPGLAGLYGAEAFISVPAEPASPPPTAKPGAPNTHSPVAKVELKATTFAAAVASGSSPQASSAAPVFVAYTGTPSGLVTIVAVAQDGTPAAIPAASPDKPAASGTPSNPAPAIAADPAEPAPLPAASPEKKAEPETKVPPAESEEQGQAGESAFNAILQLNMPLTSFDPKTVTLGTALRHALDTLSVYNPLSESDNELMLPVMFTEATKFDYIVEEDGLLISFRFQTLLQKETRVYSLKNLPGVTAEQLAAIIRQSVRPWSWRSHINDLGDQLKNGTDRMPKSMVGTLAKAGTSALEVVTEGAVSLASATAPAGDAKPATTPELSAEEMKQLAHGVVNTLTTVTHASLSALEMMHYAELPTGTMQTLPGRLVITQTQAAHREITELLEQLAEEQ